MNLLRAENHHHRRHLISISDFSLILCNLFCTLVCVHQLFRMDSQKISTIHLSSYPNLISPPLTFFCAVFHSLIKIKLFKLPYSAPPHNYCLCSTTLFPRLDVPGPLSGLKSCL